MDWRNLERFPPVTTDGWQARRRGRRGDIVGQVAVEAAVKRCHPLDTLLVAVPGSARFLPVLSIEQLKAGVQQSIRSRWRTCMSIVAASLTLTTSLAIISGGAEEWWASHVLLCLACFMVFDYWTVLRHVDASAERALFNLYVRECGRPDLWLWTAVMLVAGAAQVVGQHMLGGLEPLLMKYGVFYASMSVAECWRVLVGPFFHANFWHWASNTMMLILIGMIAGTVSRRHSVAVFLFGSAVAVLVTGVAAAAKGYEGYVGVSAGVSALFGLCIACAWRQPRQFPIQFAATLLAFSLLDDCLSWISNPDANLLAHWTGLGVGMVWGLLLCQWRKYHRTESGRLLAQQ